MLPLTLRPAQSGPPPPSPVQVPTDGHSSMAYQQNQWRVCVEFLKANQPGHGRIIRLNYAPNGVPPQLMGRIHPVRSHTAASSAARACWQHVLAGTRIAVAAALPGRALAPSLADETAQLPRAASPCLAGLLAGIHGGGGAAEPAAPLCRPPLCQELLHLGRLLRAGCRGGPLLHLTRRRCGTAGRATRLCCGQGRHAGSPLAGPWEHMDSLRRFHEFFSS